MPRLAVFSNRFIAGIRFTRSLTPPRHPPGQRPQAIPLAQPWVRVVAPQRPFLSVFAPPPSSHPVAHRPVELAHHPAALSVTEVACRSSPFRRRPALGCRVGRTGTPHPRGYQAPRYLPKQRARDGFADDPILRSASCCLGSSSCKEGVFHTSISHRRSVCLLLVFSCID